VTHTLPSPVESDTELSTPTERTIPARNDITDLAGRRPRSQPVAGQPRPSVFHSEGWLQTLRDTYGYEPFFFNGSRSQTDFEGLVFCRVNSWLTGKRLISLPFSDHCAPLVSSGEHLHHLIDALKPLQPVEGWQYLEVRPSDDTFDSVLEASGFIRSQDYLLHVVHLDASLEKLFKRFHKSSVQYRVRRAERLGLVCETGRSTKLLDDFYAMMCDTRKRQGLPPQPYVWFKNLIRCMGEEGLEIRVAYKNSIPVAAILNLKAYGTVCYKYSCSDIRHKSLNATCLLIWQTIQDAKRRGDWVLDLGRSEVDNPGLIRFKSNWAGAPTPLKYWRYPPPRPSRIPGHWKMTAARRIFSHTPQPVLNLAGRILYKHIG
jgi:hypothetical protein